MTTGTGPRGRDRGATIDELLDRAVAAINRGDRATATVLAATVLAADGANAEAEDLLAVPDQPGQIRRLTLLFADLVDSTVLSTRVEPETYRLLVGRYRETVLGAVTRYGGHIGSTAGDGLLAVFGHPIAHEDDARRAVQAGLQVVREVARLSEQARRRFGVQVQVRVGVHRGPVYLDTAQDDVYGLAANLAARVSGLASPGALVVSDAMAALIRHDFELETVPAAWVKGVGEPIVHHRVVAECPSASGSGRSPLVGRDTELACLRAAWARAQSGTLTTPGLLLRGEPGIGKSRLAAAAVDMAAECGAVVLELAGSPLQTDAGLHPIRALLERRCGIARETGEPDRLRRLAAECSARGLDPGSAVPLLAPVLGIEARAGYAPVAAEGDELYELVAGAVNAYLLACLDGAGLVVAEDVHWFDPSTREVIGALLDSADGRVLVVMTGRPGGWLPSGSRFEVCDLAPLTGSQSDALIAALDPALSADQRAQVAERCDGVPFYIEQVVNGRSEIGVPETLYEPLLARLRASPQAVPVVEAAAVVGRQFDGELLRASVDIPCAEFDRVIAELEEARVLESWEGGWRFRHELLREVAAELAPPSVRRGLHGRVADFLIRSGEPEWRLVAEHYEHAGRFGDAAAAYQQASADARRRGALAEARAHLTRSLAQLEDAPPGGERDRLEAALRLERGSLGFAEDGYQSPEAAADFERCLQLGHAHLRSDELFETLTAVANYHLIRADLRRADNVIAVLRRHFGARQCAGPVIEALSGTVALLRGDCDAAHHHLRGAGDELATGGRIDDDHGRVVAESKALARLYLALVALMRGDMDGAEDELAQAARLGSRLGFPGTPYLHAYTRSMTTWLCIESGRLDHAAEVAVDTIDHAERYGLDMWLRVGATWLSAVDALAALDDERCDPNVLAAHGAALATHLDNLRSLGVSMYTTIFDAVIGRLLIAAGEPESARDRLQAGLELARDTGMRFYDAELLRLRALTQHTPDARRADLEAARNLARRQGARLFEMRCSVDDLEFE
ncbi:cyclase [Mycobacterium sp. IS-1496]|uniref:ATP-binding protein n=1 Tax=Mycobacterium sp. IS-1496 TaxID=1772284 RepID=UPI0007417531|nr:adenylate/guanylate cyclase domain-containing protein [Mycobacterium sp. IS-1496]KUI36599.1 cyclase [Mycobacterium sp. IS-1496]